MIVNAIPVRGRCYEHSQVGGLLHCVLLRCALVSAGWAGCARPPRRPPLNQNVKRITTVPVRPENMFEAFGAWYAAMTP